MEVWKNIIGCEEYYEVSNLGNVRSMNLILDIKKLSIFETNLSNVRIIKYNQ